jgi:hypothetical protein
MRLQAGRLRGARAPRKVRTPQGRVLGNAQAGKPDGRAQQREDRRCGQRPQVRVKRCGKSAPAVPVTAPARQAPPGATPDRDDDAARRVPGRRQRAPRQRVAQMDSRPRQNPAYRPATENPRSGGGFLFGRGLDGSPAASRARRCTSAASPRSAATNLARPPAARSPPPPRRRAPHRGRVPRPPPVPGQLQRNRTTDPGRRAGDQRPLAFEVAPTGRRHCRSLRRASLGDDRRHRERHRNRRR